MATTAITKTVLTEHIIRIDIQNLLIIPYDPSSPAPAGMKNIAILRVNALATSFTLSGFSALKWRQRNRRIIPIILPGTKPLIK